MKTVLIISGGYVDTKWAAEWIRNQELVYVIAADSGLESAYRLGIKVNLILGDYDSVDEMLLRSFASTDTITYPKEKDYTDTHLAIKKAIEYIGRSDIDDICLYVIGATGTRLDHTLTNIYILDECLSNNIDAYIIDSYNKIYIRQDEFVITKNEQYGNYISLIPMTETIKVSSSGLKYNLNSTVVGQGLSLCQSNEVVDDVGFVKIESGKAVIIEARD